jgi:type I restriction enzyme S subunit
MTDINNLITDNIDVWTSAIKKRNAQGRGVSKKIELTGVKKLRELILELAVNGKLVPQDHSDEPASVLLDKIAEEKAQLIKDKKIKKQKPLPAITDEEKPSDLPHSWEWCHLQDVSSYIQRGKGPKYDDHGSVRVISQKCIQLAGFTIEPARHVSDESLEKYQEERFLKSRDLLWNSTGTGTVGRINLIDYIEEKTLVADSHVTVIRTMFLDAGFIKYFISSPNVQSRIQPGYQNSLVSGSTNQVELNTSSVMSLEVPLPPLAEQHRIVAKVDELMVLCDQLEQQTEQSLAAHQTLVEVLLAALLPSPSKSADGSSDSTEDFQTSWQRIAEHFDLLFTTELSIEQLKKTILQLAVMGKLVPQNPSDEPASVLLEKIAEEKAQLIADKKIKTQKPLPSITDEEKPFELPSSWEWCNLSELFAVVTDGDHQAPPKASSGVPFLVIGNLNTGRVVLDGCRFVPETYYEKLDWSRKPTKGDLLYTVTGSYGIPIKVTSIDEFCVQRHVAILKASISSPIQYLNYLFQSKYSYEYATEVATGIAQKTVPLTGLRKMPAALPPVAEQHRIVAKVDELMALCEQLKARLSDAQATQLHLADAVVENALAEQVIS